MLWLGLHLPQLPLEVFQRADPSPAESSLPLAICNRTHVEQASPAAAARGVRIGQQRATALAVAPDLIIRERDVSREQQALHQVAGWTLQFTPRVSLQSPTPDRADAGLLLDIEASLRLFGGLDALLERIRVGLASLGFSARIGCAPTATAAWLFARWQDGLIVRTEARLAARLADLPVGLLASLSTRREAVDAIGARVFRDLARLPRNGLARRYGKPLLQEMDLALGRQPDIRPWYQPPLHFTSTLELLADVERAEALLFAARRQLCELAGWLAARHAAVRHFVLEARHDRSRRGTPRPPTAIEARFASPTRDVERLLAVLRERLAVTGLPAAVHTLHLRCDDIVAAEADDRSLLPIAASTEESLGRLVERLQARLGRHQVQRILLAADHRPEAAYRIEPLDELPPAAPGTGTRAARPGPPLRTARTAAAARSGGSAGPAGSAGPTGPAGSAPSSSSARTAPPAGRRALPGPAAAGPLSPMLAQVPRPLWLLHQPLPLRERNQRPWWRGPLKLLCGPERIEGGWWDSHLVQRDYFIAEDDHAQWFWIYRTRGTSGSTATAGTGQVDVAPAETVHAEPLRVETVPPDRIASWYLQGFFG